MKLHPSIANPTAAVTALFLLGSLPSPAQSAEGFDISDMAPQAPAPIAGPAPIAAPATAEIADLGPSRYSGAEIPAYVRALSARFSINSRVTDAFGRYQDPEFKAPQPKAIAQSPTQRFRPEPPIAFTEVIASITVNMVTADKQQFLISGRTFTRGDVFPLQLPNGKLMKVQVTSVSSTRIEFRNVETGETAPLKLDILPPGMRKGSGGITAPGVQPTGPDAPLQVQPSSLPPISAND
jgi:hypothetical protein